MMTQLQKLTDVQTDYQASPERESINSWYSQKSDRSIKPKCDRYLCLCRGRHLAHLKSKYLSRSTHV
ncbi:hypothetical protein NSTC731_03330 [Nostoc sp. DSM 114167]|jgi:hypothetical protein